MPDDDHAADNERGDDDDDDDDGLLSLDFLIAFHSHAFCNSISESLRY